ncbi:MAG: M81 family metallopeptidase [Betaproteobacteria bacterium]|nr:M81 family metallopeptidase [Betaproteobacteria bacterium]
MARIAVAGFLHETNTFARSHTGFEAFVAADAWPGLVCGAPLLEAVAGANIAAAGFIKAASAQGHQLVPLLWASANPSGLVTRDAYEHVWDLLAHELRAAGTIDALFLDLHGTMVAEHIEDGEGELLRRIRSIVGPAMPIVAALDFHANISPQMVALTDALTVYRTYPHVDMAATGARAAALLQRALNGERWHKAYRQIPFLIPMLWQCTLVEPLAGLMQRVEVEESGGDISAAIVPGFPLADIHDCGPTILVYGIDGASTERAADRLYAAVLAQRDAFGGKLYSAVEAVARALDNAGEGPMILADTQDNPGGGAAGDTTDIPHELLRQGVQGACLGLLCDPAAAAAAHAAGCGAAVELALGGHSGIGAPPLVGRFNVEALGDGRFTGSGPFYLGCRMDLGLMARLSLNGIQILVSSHKQQAADQAMFRHLGIEPVQQRILVLKSSVHFRADFGSMAREILIVAASGENTARLSELEYQKLRPGVAVL